MNFQNTIADIKFLSGMRNTDIVNYIVSQGIHCAPSQITKLEQGKQMKVDWPLGDQLARLSKSVSDTYWGVRDLEAYGADFHAPSKVKGEDK